MNPDVFFRTVRNTHFRGRLNQQHVQGINALVEPALQEAADLRWIAYVLGTAYHETAFTMWPVEEIGRGRGRPYGNPDRRTGKTYYGRGFVQLTWFDNYAVMSQELGIDLVNRPELALKLDVATQIIWVGMKKGMFSRQRYNLPMFFTPGASDWVNARRIVNLMDRAHQIAAYSVSFYRALLLADGRNTHLVASMENIGDDAIAPVMVAARSPIEEEITSVLAETSPDDQMGSLVAS